MASAFPIKHGLVIWVASLATAVAAALLISDPGAQSQEPAAPPTDGTETALRDLAARLASLEDRVAVLQLRPYEGAPVERLVGDIGSPELPAVAGTDDADSSAMVDRLQRLEEIEQARRLEEAEAAAQLALEEERRRERDRVRIERAHAIILDPTRTDAERARAWRDLRRMEGEAWTDAVVMEMIAIGTRSEVPEVREDVWRGADGDRRHDALVRPLLRALASDPVSDVREEAAESLSNYLDVLGVLDALRLASTSDADEDVREEALKALLQG